MLCGSEDRETIPVSIFPKIASKLDSSIYLTFKECRNKKSEKPFCPLFFLPTYHST